MAVGDPPLHRAVLSLDRRWACRATQKRAWGPRDSRGATKPGPVASTLGRTGGRALEQRRPLPRVRCALGGTLELGPGLIGAAEFVEQVAAHGGQQVVGVEGG